MYGTVKEIIEHLSNYENQNEKIGAVIWHSDDVLVAVQDSLDMQIDDSLANEALKRAIENHDANLGITHETLVCSVETILEERSKA